jgi:5-methyltetrahydropteroyltriglutamate--homocysteine methyltransferase
MAVNKMIGAYITGILPRPKELIEVTRAYDRGKVSEKDLEKAFDEATAEVVKAQTSLGLTYVCDGMLKWQDLLRPFTENLGGVTVGSLTRWFNNNTFYRMPIVTNKILREKSVFDEWLYIKRLPKHIPWKAIVPAPYTFAKLAENHFYKDENELMFDYSKALRSEIENLAKTGFKYIQLSDPALVYSSAYASLTVEELGAVSEALEIAVKGVPVKTCLQTFFGDFSRILPEAFDFPVDHLGIDLYETSLEEIEQYPFEKGVALGLVDSRNSLVEKQDELVRIAKTLLKSIYNSDKHEVFICPNCDLEFLPWERAKEKMKLIAAAAEQLKKEFDGDD